MDGKKLRSVLICHPDFDQPGAAGVAEAKRFAEQLIEGQKQMIEQARKSGESPEVVDQVKRYVESMMIVVRQIPEDII